MLNNVAKLAHDLRGFRDDHRRLLGLGLPTATAERRYENFVQPYRDVLKGLQAERGGDLAAIALEEAKRMEAAGHNPAGFLCAFVDLSEGREGQ